MARAFTVSACAQDTYSFRPLTVTGDYFPWPVVP